MVKQTFSLERTPNTFTAHLLVGHRIVSTAIGYFDAGKVAVYRLETVKEFRRQGYATKLLRDLHDSTGFDIYPLQVIKSEESSGFWTRWYMEQEGVPLPRARVMALQEMQVRSPWEIRRE